MLFIGLITLTDLGCTALTVLLAGLLWWLGVTVIDWWYLPTALKKRESEPQEFLREVASISDRKQDEWAAQKDAWLE